jgi:hypothetical protein
LNGWCPKSLASGFSANALGGDEPEVTDAAECANVSFLATLNHLSKFDGFRHALSRNP